MPQESEGFTYAWTHPNEVIQAALAADLGEVLVLGISKDGSAYHASSTANRELIQLMIERGQLALNA